MISIRFHLEARQEYQDSIAWYLQRSVRAAIRFESSVDSVLNTIRSNLVQFASYDDIHFEAPVRLFPYIIVYRKEQNAVLIVSIAHTKRKPRYWEDRN